MIPVNTPRITDAERRWVLEALDAGWISSEGPYLERFEQAMAAKLARRHAIAVCNGTAALQVAIEALNLGPGDEVILPTFTIISCAAAIVRVGAVPVVVDSDPVAWTMDLSQIASRITPRTRALMAVHMYGLPVPMDPVLELAQRHGLAVIEDAAEGLGITYRGRPCGSFGAVSTLSFYANKLVTTGEGGMVLTDDDALARRARSLRNLCFRPERRFVHDELGWNYRMTTLQAALGLAQLEAFDDNLARKRRLGRRYDEAFADLPDVARQPAGIDGAASAYWVYGLVPGDRHALDAPAAMARLQAAGVGTRPFFWPLHEQPVLRARGLFAGERHPVAERLARRGFYVPSGLGLTDAEQDSVIERVRALFT